MLVEFAVVVMRYVFGVGSVKMQESIVYMHATVFMVAAGYTLLHNGHVRCDIFYAEATPRAALIDLIGVLDLPAPDVRPDRLGGMAYVAAAWAVREGSQEGSLGIPASTCSRASSWCSPALLALQGVAMAIHSALRLARSRGARVSRRRWRARAGAASRSGWT